MTTRTTTANARLSLGRRPELLAVVLLLVFGLVNAMLQPGFFGKDIVASNMTTFLPLMLIAAGQFYVVLGGSIDLSLGAIVSLVNVVVVQLITHFGGGVDAIAIGVFSGIAVGAVCGAVNGFLISAVRLQAIVTTFATSIVISGIALRVLPQAGGELPESYYGTYGGDVFGIPFVILGAVALVIAILVIAKTKFVAHLTALGGSPHCAYQTGLPLIRLRIISHAVGGVFASFAALAILGVAGAGDPLMGQAFTLSSVSAVVLGGVALAGGWGSAWGAVLGAVLLGLINNLIFFANIDYVYQSVVQGAIILLALAGGVYTGRRPQ